MLFGHQVLMEYVYYYVLKIKTETSNVEKRHAQKLDYKSYISNFIQIPLAN